jgi:hypothetical protein
MQNGFVVAAIVPVHIHAVIQMEIGEIGFPEIDFKRR